MDWFRSLPDYRRKIYLLLIVAILLTLPCYCVGLVLLTQAPEETAPPSSLPAGSGLLGEAVALWGAAPGPGLAAVQPAGAGPRPAVRAMMARPPQSQAGLGPRLPAAA